MSSTTGGSSVWMKPVSAMVTLVIALAFGTATAHASEFSSASMPVSDRSVSSELEVVNAQALKTLSESGKEIVQVSLGTDTSAAVMSDGSLWTWGDNVGDGTGEESTSPVKVMDGVSRVCLKGLASAAIKDDGSLWMWGDNTSGKLGFETSVDGTYYPAYSPVKVMDGVSQVVLGSNHTAAIKTDASLWMWGDNGFGEVGDGATEDRYSPVKVMDDVSQVVLGEYCTAAIKTDGSLWMWGRNRCGLFGDGTDEDRYSPVEVMDGVIQVAFGSEYAAAIKTDGSLWMWGGTNGYGQLGDERWGSSCDIPTEVMGGVSRVYLSGSTSVALKDDGSLWAWGYNKNGLVGDGTTEDRYSPVEIMNGVSQVALGGGRKVVVRDDGSLWTWGLNYYGALGDGTDEARQSPVRIMDGVLQVIAGNSHTAALKDDGSLWTWGQNWQGAVGDGTTEKRLSPVCIFRDGKWVSGGAGSPDNSDPDGPSQFPIDYKKDTWPFANPNESVIAYRVCKDMLGNTLGGAVYAKLKSGAEMAKLKDELASLIGQGDGESSGGGGLCYGMTQTVLASYLGYPNVGDYEVVGSSSNRAAYLYQVQEAAYNYGIKSSAIDLIRHAHVYQYSLESTMSASLNDDLNGLYEAAYDFQYNDGEPVSVTLSWGSLLKKSYHEVAVLGVEVFSDQINVKLYNCNAPGEDEYLALFKDSGAFTGEWAVCKDGADGETKVLFYSGVDNCHFKYRRVTRDFINTYKTRVARGEPTRKSLNEEEDGILVAIDKGVKGTLRYGAEEIDIEDIYDCDSESVLPVEETADEDELIGGSVFCWLVGDGETVVFDNLEGEGSITVVGTDVVMTAQATTLAIADFDALSNSVQVSGSSGDPFSVSFDYYGEESVRSVVAVGVLEDVAKVTSEDGIVNVSGVSDVVVSESTTDLSSEEGEAQCFNIGSAMVSGITDRVYTGKALTQNPVVDMSGETLVEGIDYETSYRNNVNAGTATIIIIGKGNYVGSKSVTFTIKRASNKATVKKITVKKSFRVKKLKKKAATISLPKVTTTFGKAMWKVTTKDTKKVLSFKNGKIKVKKGAKKGKYTIKLKASVAGTKNYKVASTKVVTVAVTVK